jgi:HK97 family phage major capsid protein
MTTTADPNVTSVPQNELAAVTPLPLAPDAAPDVRQHVDTLNQNFQELCRAQREQAAAHGLTVSANDERIAAINQSLEAAADQIARQDAALRELQARPAASGPEDAGDADDFRNDPAWDAACQRFLRHGGQSLSDAQRLILAQANRYHEILESASVSDREAPNWDPVAAVVSGAGLSTTFGPGAGVWARPQFDNAVTKLLVEFSPIRGFARVINIGAAEYVGVLRTADRDTIEQVGEHGTSAGPTQQTQLNRYVERRIRPYIYWAKPALSTEMVEDSVIDIMGELTQDVALDFAVDESTLFTTGSGANEPHGYAVDDEVGGIDSRASGVIDHHDLTNLSLSLRPFYRTGASYAFSTTAFRAAILEEDGLGRRLWQPSQQEGFPGLLNGWRYWESVAQADVATAAKPVFFANWSMFYRIVDRRGMQVIRDDITTDGLIILKHSRRYGGRTWLTEAGKALTVS